MLRSITVNGNDNRITLELENGDVRTTITSVEYGDNRATIMSLENGDVRTTITPVENGANITSVKTGDICTTTKSEECPHFDFFSFIKRLISICIGVAMIVIGANGMNDCTVEPMIPKFLVGKYE